MNITATIIAITAGVACLVPSCTNNAPVDKSACETAVVTVAWDQETTCDLTPPQTLDLTYANVTHEFFVQDSANAGGTPATDDDGTFRCLSVDY